MTSVLLIADKRRNSEEHVSTISILTTCRGRERPGDQIWLAGEGFEKEEKAFEKRER